MSHFVTRVEVLLYNVYIQLGLFNTLDSCFFFTAVSTPEAVHNISETIRREQELKHSPSTHSSSTPKRTHLAVSESKAARESVRASKSRETSLKKQDKSCQSRSARPRPPSSRTRPHLTSSSTSHAQQSELLKK